MVRSTLGAPASADGTSAQVIGKGLVYMYGEAGRCAGSDLRSDECHQELERTGEGQGRPGAAQATDGAVAQTGLVPLLGLEVAPRDHVERV
jgi:hypothetical protein